MQHELDSVRRLPGAAEQPSRLSADPEPKVDSLSADRSVAALADAQCGLVTLGQLEAAGLGAGAIAHRARHGRLHRVHRGVYSVGHTLLSRDGRLWAAVLAYGDGAAISHLTAADHLEIRPTSRAQIDVTVQSQSGRYERSGTKLHRSRSLPPSDVTLVRHIPTTTAARTLVDIAGVLRPAQLERAVDRAEALDLLDLNAVQACLLRRPSSKGHGTLAGILDQYEQTGLTKSDLEDLFLELCSAHGIPRPRVNAFVQDVEVDFFWPRERLIVEADSRTHHGTRAAFERDRARDARFIAAGYRVIRFTYRQVLRDPAFVVATLRTVLGVVH